MSQGRWLFWVVLLWGLSSTIAPARLTATEPASPAPFYSDKLDLLFYLDAEGRRHPVKTTGDWELRRGHVLENFQSVAGRVPPPERKVPLDVKVTEVTELSSYVRKKLTYATEANDHVPAYLLLPKGTKQRRPAVLCLHQTTGIGKEEPVGLGGKKNLHYAAELAERGFVTLAPDFPYLGENHYDPYANGYLSCTMKGIWNHMCGVDLLQSLPEVDAARIGVIGHSLGGHNSVFLAAFDARIKCVVSCCGYCTHAAYKNGLGRLPWYGVRYMPRFIEVSQEDVSKCPFDMSELVGAIAPRPFLTVAPLRDSNFPIEGVRDCIRAATPVYQLYGAEKNLAHDYPDTSHTFPPSSREKAYAWFDRWLKPAH